MEARRSIVSLSVTNAMNVNPIPTLLVVAVLAGACPAQLQFDSLGGQAPKKLGTPRA